MQIVKAFTYVVQDSNWPKKVLIGSLVTAVPLVEAITDGYQIQTIRNLKAGQPRPLPEWDDVGGLFRQGLGLRLVIYLIYVPLLILTLITLILDFGWIFSAILSLFSDREASTSSMGFSIWRPLLRYLGLPLMNFIVVTLLPVVFLIVPALARRRADGDSVLALLNPFPTLRLIFSNFSIYVLTRVLVVALVTVVTTLTLPVDAIPVIGVLIGWLLLAVARFWGRMAWAYSLAHMKR